MSIRGRIRAFADGDQRLHRLCWLALGALVAFPFLALVVQVDGGPFRFGGADFKAYYLAGLRARHGLPLYEAGTFVERVAQPRATRFLYPPVVALPFATLSILPPVPARWLWTVGQLVFLWWAVLVLLRGFGVRLSWTETIVACVALLGLQPVFYLVRVGNASGFMAGLFCLSAAVTVAPEGPRRPHLGGAATALGVAVKPFAAPAGAHLLGDRRRVLAAVGAAVALFLVGVAAFGLDAHRAYLDVLRSSAGWTGHAPNGLPFHAWPYYRVRDLAPVIRGVLLGITFGASVLAARGGADARAFVLGSLAIPLVAPGANTLTLVLALPGLVVALALEAREDGLPELVLAAVLAVHASVYLVRIVGLYGPNAFPRAPWGVLQGAVVVQPATVGLLAVFGLCVARVVARTRDG